LDVPEVLVVLRDMLMVLDGFSAEGIFRKSGTENGINGLKVAFMVGGFPDCEDVHSIAGAIKRWFKELPKRICSTLDSSVIFSPKVTQLYEFLEVQDLILFTWLLEMLAEVLLFSDQNNMDPTILCEHSFLSHLSSFIHEILSSLLNSSSHHLTTTFHNKKKKKKRWNGTASGWQQGQDQSRTDCGSGGKETWDLDH
jgi:hypothetical protein